MKSYISKIDGFSSKQEHFFYEETTKKQMFLIIESFATLLKLEEQTWCQKALEELHILKLNGVE